MTRVLSLSGHTDQAAVHAQEGLIAARQSKDNRLLAWVLLEAAEASLAGQELAGFPIPLGDFIRGTPDGNTADAILRKCVHCGFCTATCPTYQLLGDELDGPRGRIYLMKQVFEGAEPTRCVGESGVKNCGYCSSSLMSSSKY